MKTPDPVTAARLIFRWPERSVSFLLPGFFLLAVAVHGVAFYLFQVVYPPVISSAPPRAQVWLLSHDEPRHQALLEWVEAQNPASALPQAAGEGMAGVTYRPSYAAVRTLPQPAVREVEAVAYPSGWPGPGEAVAKGKTPGATLTPGRVVSSLRFSTPLATRVEGGAEPIPVQAAGKVRAVDVRNDLLPTVFLVALSDRGEVRHLFLQRSSGHDGLDAQAEHLLRGYPFSSRPGDAPPLTWGEATLVWGADVVAGIDEAAAGRREP